MRAWIENDDDITCFIEIDVYEGGEMIEAHGIPCRPLPWRIEFDTIDVIADAIDTEWMQEDD